MDTNNPSEWTTVVGKKRNCTDKKRHTLPPGDITSNKKIPSTKIPDMKMPDVITPEDIYYANVTRIDSPSLDISEHLTTTIVNQMKKSTTLDSLEILGNIAVFVIENMANIIKKMTVDTSCINDDQKIVISTNGYLEHIEKIHTSINVSLSMYSENAESMTLIKNTSIENIKKFLATCGINEILPYGRKKDNTETSDYCFSHEDSKLSYADSIGITLSDLVVEKQPVKIINNVMYQKTGMVNIDMVDINMPIITKIQDSVEFTISYLDYCKVFVIRMGSTVFTTGPGNFVNLKNSNGTTKHAKRCLNPQPCRYKNCKYYHDPCIVYDEFNTHRNFALSYVLQMLGAVKDSIDIQENKMVRNPNFVRDLVQLGGIILIKAAQIKALHFSGKKI